MYGMQMQSSEILPFLACDCCVVFDIVWCDVSINGHANDVRIRMEIFRLAEERNRKWDY